jgi:RNA polymerase sigma-70 factor (ECF subfamily)
MTRAARRKRDNHEKLTSRVSPDQITVMQTTPASLLLRLRQPGEQRAWQQFVDLYTPLLFHWSMRLGLNEADAADLVQDVFVILSQRLNGFDYDRGKSFRGWLRTILTNKWRDRRRRATLPLAEDDAVEQVASPQDGDLIGEAEYREFLVTRALEVMQAEFQPTTWKACWEHVVAGRSAAEVGRELGISANAVYIAKSRVLRRLRAELEGLLE